MSKETGTHMISKHHCDRRTRRGCKDRCININADQIRWRWSPFFYGNISGANQPLRANYGNFNLSHQINIQGEGRREVERWICKSVITQSKGRVQIVKLSNPPYSLDVDPITQIWVSIVCTERLVCTWYVPLTEIVLCLIKRRVNCTHHTTTCQVGANWSNNL